MKRALIFLIFICTPLLLMAQKKGISYQAVILDPKPLDIPGNPISGQPLQKGKVTLRFSIGNASSLDYVEIHQTETDEFGLINVTIGQGDTNGSLNTNSSSMPNAKFNSFDAIIWDENQKNLAVGVSFDGGKTFSEVSNQKLSFSPYALYAEAVEYKNVREAPKKLSQFSNDTGYLISKDLDPISESLSLTNRTIKSNQLLTDQSFAIVNKQLFSLSDSIQLNSKTIAKNAFSISDIEKKLVDVNGQIAETKNESQSNLNRLSSNINGLQSQLFSTNNALSNLASTYEIVDNKSSAADLGNDNPSDQLYPSQKATKTYIDTKVADLVGGSIADATTLAPGKIQLAGDLGGTAASPSVPGLASKENSGNKSINVAADANSDLKYPSVKAVKSYVDQATQGIALQATVDAKANTSDVNAALSTKENSSNKSNNAALGNSEELFPTQKAVKTYVDNQVANGIVSDADASTKGKIQLTGDLGGTAASPTVPELVLKANTADVSTALSLKANATDVSNALALKMNTSDLANAITGKEEVSNKSTSATLGTSDVLYPSQKAVKTYVDASVASGAPDADASTKGKIQLSGDLGGTAASPTVPGLALKADVADVTSALSLKANASDVASSLSLKANGSDVSNALALKMNTSDLANAITGKEEVSNKSTSATLGTSDVLYPSQKAVKTYVDASVASGAPDADASTKGKIQLSGDLGGTAASPTVPGLALKADAADVTISLAAKANSADVSSALASKANASDVTSALVLKANSTDVTNALSLKANTLDVTSALSLKANGSDVSNSLALKAPINNPTFTGTVGGLDKTMVGLSNVDNTSDANKPISSAGQTALNLKANTADVNSALNLKANEAQVISALNLKANITDVATDLAAKANTLDVASALSDKENSSNKSTSSALGTSDVLYPSQKAVKTYVDASVASGAPDADASTKGKIQLSGDLGGTAASPTVPGLALKADAADVTSALSLKANASDVASSLSLKANGSDVSNSLALKAPINNPAFTGTVGGIDKSMVGLSNLDNTSDANKPISTAAQTALNLKANVSDVSNSLALKAPINNPTFTGTVGGVDKTMVGLSNVDNTSDANKPISSAGQTALNLKANTADVNSALNLKANEAQVISALNLKANITDVATDLAAKANTLDVTSALASKEMISNKSTSAALGASDDLYPTQKAVKSYVDARTPDADASTKGKIKLAGDLAGTSSSASSPIISNAAINTDKLADDAVTSSKISNGTITTIDLQDNLITTSKIANGAVATDDIANSAVTDGKIVGISGNKVSGNISGNSANVTSTVAIGNGGTGSTTQQAAITTLTGSQSSGKYLRSNGTNALLANIQASDVPTLNQNTSGSAASLGTARNIYGNSFDGTASLTQIITSTFGGTGNGFSKFSGPSSSEKTFTLPNSNATILTSASAVTVAQGGTGTNSLAANQVLLGNGTSAIQAVAPGSAGNVLTSNGSTWISSANSFNNTHSIGESYGGGIVFYVYDGGTHGLIAATNDQSSNADWGLGTGYETRAKANGIAAGIKNTTLIIASEISQRKTSQEYKNYGNGYNGQDFAATICNEFYVSITENTIETTFGDWYLPSKYELNLLYQKRTTVGNFASDKYWSSTEYDSDKAWNINFATRSGSAENTDDKTNGHRVRAIRAF